LGEKLNILIADLLKLDLHRLLGASYVSYEDSYVRLCVNNSLFYLFWDYL